MNHERHFSFEALKDLLAGMVTLGVSDLHVRPNRPPYWRDPQRRMVPAEAALAAGEPRVVAESDVIRFARWICRGTRHLEALDSYLRWSEERRTTDPGWESSDSGFSPLTPIETDVSLLVGIERIEGEMVCVPLPEDLDADFVARRDVGMPIRRAYFRASIFSSHQSDPLATGLSLCLRRILPEIPSEADLGFNKAVTNLLIELRLQKITSGLILVVGATGSGKSTTVARILETLNETQSRHIVLFEDPVEFVFTDKNCFFTQIGIGKNIGSLSEAALAVRRQDPDVIVFGELRTPEHVRLAFELAATNHLVLATRHASSNSPAALLNAFETSGFDRALYGPNVVAVIAQKLLSPSAKSENQKAVLVQEVLRPSHNPALLRLLADGEKDLSRYEAAIGTPNTEAERLEIRFEEALLEAVVARTLDPQQARAAAERRKPMDDLLIAHERERMRQSPGRFGLGEPKTGGA